MLNNLSIMGITASVADDSITAEDFTVLVSLFPKPQGNVGILDILTEYKKGIMEDFNKGKMTQEDYDTTCSLIKEEMWFYFKTASILN